MLLFLLLPIAGQVYVSWRVWAMLPSPLWMKVIVVSIMAISFLCLILNFILPAERMPLWLSQVIYETGTSWIIILLYLTMLFAAIDLLQLLHIIPRSFNHNSPIGTITVTAILLVTFVFGNIHYHKKVKVPLELAAHGKVSKPVKIVMMSDLHLGYHNRRSEFARWVDLINQEEPDLILIAGDIIDINVNPLIRENVADEWKRLKAPVYACIGNHEYYAHEQLAQKFIANAGIHLLQDSAVNIGDLCIVGRDDLTNRRRLPLEHLMTDVDHNKYVILLDHQPFKLEQAEKAHVDFQFSGHTHNGQIWPINLIARKMYENSWGLSTRGNTVYYVTSGMGIWGGKFRIGTQSEYVVAIIK